MKATAHREINVCSLYIPPDNTIEENDLNKFMAHLPKTFRIRMKQLTIDHNLKTTNTQQRYKSCDQ